MSNIHSLYLWLLIYALQSLFNRFLLAIWRVAMHTINK